MKIKIELIIEKPMRKQNFEQMKKFSEGISNELESFIPKIIEGAEVVSYSFSKIRKKKDLTTKNTKEH